MTLERIGSLSSADFFSLALRAEVFADQTVRLLQPAFD
jgi:hypothetical protein